MSPTAAWMSFGAKLRVPFEPPTRTTWTLTIPEEPVPADAAAEDVADCAERFLLVLDIGGVLDTNLPRAPATLRAERAKVVNCILNDSKDPDLKVTSVRLEYKS